MSSGMNVKIKSLFCFLLTNLLLQPAIAGSGFYYGIDAVFNSLDTSTEVSLTFTPPPPAPSLLSDQSSQSFSDVGLHVGYLFKHRRTQSYFIAPEFYLTSFDSDDAIYGTSFKFGKDIDRWRVSANLGVSRFESFKQNKLHLGLGAEYAINDHLGIGIEWLRIDTIEENTAADSAFGAQTLTTDTHTTRDIDVIKVSIRVYLLE